MTNVRESRLITEKNGARTSNNRPQAGRSKLDEQQRRQFGDRLYAVREQLGLTRQQFSDRFGMPFGTLKALEDGRFNPLPPMRLVLRLLELNPQLVETAATVDRKIGPCVAVKP